MSQIPAEARIVVQFSCGAASAVASTLARFPAGPTKHQPEHGLLSSHLSS